jgi:hypothetical protein
MPVRRAREWSNLNCGLIVSFPRGGGKIMWARVNPFNEP